jgi:hypothetical protein
MYQHLQLRKILPNLYMFMYYQGRLERAVKSFVKGGLTFFKFYRPQFCSNDT